MCVARTTGHLPVGAAQQSLTNGRGTEPSWAGPAPSFPAEQEIVAVVESLTQREIQVLRLVAAGRRNHEIAHDLRISVKTVEFHLSNIRDKLGVRSRTEAVVRAAQVGLLALTPRSQPAPAHEAEVTPQARSGALRHRR
jgi:DNA-binding NarL/FixJ family response regulator